jgi:hypothetical protein
MALSMESFINFQPTADAIIEVGGNRFEVYNCNPLTVVAAGLRKAVEEEFSPRPVETLPPDNASILEIFEAA